MYSLVKRKLDIWKELPAQERQLLLKYNGFDLEHIIDCKDIHGIDLTLSNKDSYVIYINENNKEFNDKRFNFIGYDCGILKEYGEYIFYSVIVNEIRVSGNDYIKSYHKKLNDYYLFNNKKDIISYLEKRKEAIDNDNISGLETAYSHKDINFFEIYLLK